MVVVCRRWALGLRVLGAVLGLCSVGIMALGFPLCLRREGHEERLCVWAAEPRISAQGWLTWPALLPLTLEDEELEPVYFSTIPPAAYLVLLAAWLGFQGLVLTLVAVFVPLLGLRRGKERRWQGWLLALRALSAAPAAVFAFLAGASGILVPEPNPVPMTVYVISWLGAGAGLEVWLALLALESLAFSCAGCAEPHNDDARTQTSMTGVAPDQSSTQIDTESTPFGADACTHFQPNVAPVPFRHLDPHLPIPAVPPSGLVYPAWPTRATTAPKPLPVPVPAKPPIGLDTDGGPGWGGDAPKTPARPAPSATWGGPVQWALPAPPVHPPPDAPITDYGISKVGSGADGDEDGVEDAATAIDDDEGAGGGDGELPPPSVLKTFNQAAAEEGEGAAAGDAGGVAGEGGEGALEVADELEPQNPKPNAAQEPKPDGPEDPNSGLAL